MIGSIRLIILPSYYCKVYLFILIRPAFTVLNQLEIITRQTCGLLREPRKYSNWLPFIYTVAYIYIYISITMSSSFVVSKPLLLINSTWLRLSLMRFVVTFIPCPIPSLIICLRNSYSTTTFVITSS